MISNKLKFIFIHIPRTGGTSIERKLEKYCTIKPTEYSLKGYKKHSSLENAKEVLENCFDEYYKFAFVRNPWDRLLSIYFWGMQIQDRWSYKRFNCWVNYFIKKRLYKLYVPQIDLIIINNKIELDYLGRFERLNEDWKIICKKLGKNIKLPKIYSTKHKNYKEYYNDKSRKIVEEIYKKDIINFKYKYND